MEDPNPFPEHGTPPLYCSTLQPGTRERRPMPEGSTFNEAEADKAVRFFRLLKHTQGPKAGEEFVLTPEQRWLIREAFGWMRSSGTRLFRIVFVEMGRGNGKTQLGAGIAGKLLFADGEADPEVVGAASDRKQARICLNRLKSMVAASEMLAQKALPFRNEVRRKGGGWYEATSSDVASAWGGAPHGIIFDEVHAQPSRELWDALETAMGKRAQPMMWGLTTAGWDRETLCWELHERARETAEGIVEDNEYLGVVWAASEDDDWTDPEVWRKANPMMGEAFTQEFIEAKCRKAINTPAFQNSFRTLYLSQWVGQETRFIPMQAWDAAGGSIAPPSKRVPAFGGLDLSSTTDLSSFQVVYEQGGEVHVETKIYAPAEGIRDRSRRDRVPYEVWAREGILTLTPGSTIDQDVIKRDIMAAKEKYDLRDVGYDRWNASKLVRELEAEGITMVQIGQGFASMSAPTKHLLELILQNKFRHGGNPILRWMADCTQALVDAADNVKPDKKKSSARIDGIVATIIALDGLMRRGRGAERRSVYEDRGLTLL